MNNFWNFKVEEGELKMQNFGFIQTDLSVIVGKLFNVVIIIALMILSIKFGGYIINKIIKKNKVFSIDERKARTIETLLKSLLRYAVYIIGVFLILANFLAGITVSIGVGAAVFGFAAQNLIKDIINGIFILFEDQFVVGDYISVNKISGIVESMELRITKIRDFNGDLHIVPNSSINQVTNHSRGNMRILVDVSITYQANVDEAINVIKETCLKAYEEHEDIVEIPKVVGVVNLAETGVTIRTVGKAKPMSQWDCENKLRKDIKLALDKANIQIAYPAAKACTANN
jgi:small conductance mechanosensitive channel